MRDCAQQYRGQFDAEAAVIVATAVALEQAIVEAAAIVETAVIGSATRGCSDPFSPQLACSQRLPRALGSRRRVASHEDG